MHALQKKPVVKPYKMHVKKIKKIIKNVFNNHSMSATNFYNVGHFDLGRH